MPKRISKTAALNAALTAAKQKLWYTERDLRGAHMSLSKAREELKDLVSSLREVAPKHWVGFPAEELVARAKWELESHWALSSTSWIGPHDGPSSTVKPPVYLEPVGVTIGQEMFEKMEARQHVFVSYKERRVGYKFSQDAISNPNVRRNIAELIVKELTK